MELKLDLTPFDKPPFFPSWMKENPKGVETDIFSSTMNPQLDEIMEQVKKLSEMKIPLNTLDYFNFEEEYNDLSSDEIKYDCLYNILGFLFDVERGTKKEDSSIARDNKEYYKSIIAKILENNAKGNVESIISILRFIYNTKEGKKFQFKPNYPAGVKILYDDSVAPNEPLERFIKYMLGAGIGYTLYPNWTEISLNDYIRVVESVKKRYYFLDEIHYDKIRNILPANEKEFPYSGIVQNGIMAENRTDNKLTIKDELRYQFYPLIRYDGTYKYDGDIKYDGGWVD